MKTFLKKFKLIIITLALVIVTAIVLAVTSHAVEVSPTQELKQPDLTISADSVSEEVSYTVTYDAVTNTNILTLNVQTFGVCIYDDLETKYLDGIRLNGETVPALSFPVDLTKENKITVRTVYKEDFTGTMAQIADGTYDYTELLKNPITLLMGVYYVAAFVSVLCGIIATVTGRKKKIKTANEIAGTVDEHSKQAFDALTVNFTSEVTKTLEPMFKTMSDTQVAIIKAITLMNSKEDGSHLQALECLAKVASVDVQKVISVVHEELEKTMYNAQAHKQEVIESLTRIAETAQEESANVNTPPVF